ncbi:MAG TPA: MFS transporter [Acidimicrobiia bacterium]
MATAVAPLRISRFRALWTASIFSNVGTFLQSAAAAWLILELTGSATWVGLMSASTTLPFLALALVAGAVADMVERTKVLLVAQSVMGLAALVMAVLTFTDHISPEGLVGLGLVMGVAGAFNLPAWQALVPDLVPREMVASAVALNSVAFNVARAIGPVAGGLLVATVGAEAGFFLNALSFLGVIVVIAVIRRRMVSVAREPASMSVAIGLGLRFARYTPAFRRVLAIGAAFGLTSAVVQTALPSHTAALGGGSVAYGILLGAMGVGAIIAAFFRKQVVEGLGRRSVPVTIVAFSLAGVGVGLVPGPAAAVPLLVIAGACWVWTLTTLNATTQLMTPGWVRGRAMSLYTLAFIGVYPLGSIMAGAVADAIGTRLAYVIVSGAGVVVGLIATRLAIPSIAEVESPAFEEERPAVTHMDTLDSGPVMIQNTWEVDDADREAFLEAMEEVRLVRLRTGAYRWRLYRDAANPRRFTEVFLTVSWEEHLNQHRRLDDASAAAIRKARSIGRMEPATRHLLAVDLENPPEWSELLALHSRYHEEDGSVPLGS